MKQQAERTDGHQGPSVFSPLPISHRFTTVVQKKATISIGATPFLMVTVRFRGETVS